MRLFLLSLFFLIFFLLSVFSENNTSVNIPNPTNGSVLNLNEYIQLTASNSFFEKFLIEEMKIKYRLILKIDPSDFILSSKGEYILSSPRPGTTYQNSEIGISLSKLFYLSGTKASIDLTKGLPSLSSTESHSKASFRISQPIIKNAFGKINQVKKQIAGREVDIARYQVVEAYEDFFSALIKQYYNWYSASEAWLLAIRSLKETQLILKTMKKRFKLNVADKSDINKLLLQQANKKASILQAKNRYNEINFEIHKMLSQKNNKSYFPSFENFELYQVENLELDKDNFLKKSRTIKILKKLEKNSENSLLIAKNNLLPSTELYMAFQTLGDDYSFWGNAQNIQTGVSLNWPTWSKQDRAKEKIAQLNLQQVKLNSYNTKQNLKTSLSKLISAIETKKQIIILEKNKEQLAKSVLIEEEKLYRQGRSSINDLLQAINQLNSIQFNNINSQVDLEILKIEWLRITDQLVLKKIN